MITKSGTNSERTENKVLVTDSRTEWLKFIGRTLYGHNVSVFGPSTWNDLPLPLRQKPSPDSFKSNLNTVLFPKL